jgi:hypothetical protein
MAKNKKANGKRTRNMAVEYIIIQMAVNMTANGKRVKNMAAE